MCTVTWLQAGDTYEVFCNRDEQRFRSPAYHPRKGRLNHMTYIAPIDSQAGGSWVGVNERGLTLCLLNHYPTAEIPLPGKPTSRGLLLLSLLEHTSQSQVKNQLRYTHLKDYPPFILLVMEPRQRPLSCTWDGREFVALVLDQHQLPLSTSSFDRENVIKQRRACFKTYLSSYNPLDRQALLAFHKSHVPEAGAYSVCMHRDEAETVSFSHVIVCPQDIHFYHTPQSPCQEDGQPTTLTTLSRSE